MVNLWRVGGKHPPLEAGRTIGALHSLERIVGELLALALGPQQARPEASQPSPLRARIRPSRALQQGAAFDAVVAGRW